LGWAGAALSEKKRIDRRMAATAQAVNAKKWCCR
jgi:hypothetical protein